VIGGNLGYYYYYYYFGPGHFGWLFWLSQGFALPLKCPEFPACGLSAKAAAAPPKDMLSASISAVINNVIRLFISSHPLSLIVLNTISPKRDAWRGMHTLKPHPFCYLRGWGSLFRALSVVTPPPFGSLATSLLERSMGFAPPPCGGVAFIAAPERQSARERAY
jgi:hypothetical protein